MNDKEHFPGSNESGGSHFEFVQPNRDLQSNWEVDLAKKLEEYLLKICSGEISSVQDHELRFVNFAEAALLLQGSVQVYSQEGRVSSFFGLACVGVSLDSPGSVEQNFEARLTGIDIVIGRLAVNTACSSRGQSCVPNRVLLLNKCDFLQKYMNCKGGCFASIGSDQPAEVVDDAPRNLKMLQNEPSKQI